MQQFKLHNSITPEQRRELENIVAVEIPTLLRQISTALETGDAVSSYKNAQLLQRLAFKLYMATE